MTPTEVLETVGIGRNADRVACLEHYNVHHFSAPDQSTRDDWLTRLIPVCDEAGYVPLVVGKEIVLPEGELNERMQPLPPEESDKIIERASERLATLDRSGDEITPITAPNHARALLDWRDQHPAGAPLSSLVEALQNAPEEPCSRPELQPIPADPGVTDRFAAQDEELIIWLCEADSASEVLAWFDFGNFDACPAAETHVAMAMRWQRDYDARLIYLGVDRYSYWVSRKPHNNDTELRRLISEQAALFANDRPSEGALERLHYWNFWWD